MARRVLGGFWAVARGGSERFWAGGSGRFWAGLVARGAVLGGSDLAVMGGS